MGGVRVRACNASSHRSLPPSLSLPPSPSCHPSHTHIYICNCFPPPGPSCSMRSLLQKKKKDARNATNERTNESTPIPSAPSHDAVINGWQKQKQFPTTHSTYTACRKQQSFADGSISGTTLLPHAPADGRTNERVRRAETTVSGLLLVVVLVVLLVVLLLLLLLVPPGSRKCNRPAEGGSSDTCTIHWNRPHG